MSRTLQLLVWVLLSLITSPSNASDADNKPSAELSLEETQAALLDRVSSQRNVDVNDIEVIEAEAKTWPDGSLGCPSMRRTLGRSGPVQGYRFVLLVDDARATFHTDAHGRILRCETTQKPLGPITR